MAAKPVWAALLLVHVALLIQSSAPAVNAQDSPTIGSTLEQIDNSVLLNSLALASAGNASYLFQRGFQGPLYRSYPNRTFGAAAEPNADYICLFSGLTQASSATPRIRDTIKCVADPAGQVFRSCNVSAATAPCFGTDEGASLVWYCKDIFLYRTEAPVAQTCLNRTFGLDLFERAYNASAADIYTMHTLIKGLFFSSLPATNDSSTTDCSAELDPIKSVWCSAQNTFQQACGSSCPLVQSDKDSIIANVTTANLVSLARKAQRNNSTFTAQIANLDCFANRQLIGKAIEGRLNLDLKLGERAKQLQKFLGVIDQVSQFKLFAKGPFKALLNAADRLGEALEPPVNATIRTADALAEACAKYRKLRSYYAKFLKFSALVEGLVGLLEGYYYPVVDLITCQGASIAYSKGAQVCNDPIGRELANTTGELTYVPCIRDLTETLEAQANFYRKAVFEPIVAVFNVLFDIADALDQLVRDFIDPVQEVLDAIERGFKAVVDPIVDFLSSLLSFIPDVKCPEELSFICNLDELIIDALSKAFEWIKDQIGLDIPSLEEIEEWIVNEIRKALGNFELPSLPDVFDFDAITELIDRAEKLLQCATSQISGEEPLLGYEDCPNFLQELLNLPVPSFSVFDLVSKVTTCGGQPLSILGSKVTIGFSDVPPRFTCTAGQVPVVSSAVFTCLLDDTICQVDMTGSFLFPCGTDNTTISYPCTPATNFFNLRGNCCSQQRNRTLPGYRNAPASYVKISYFCESDLDSLKFIPPLVLAQSATGGAVVATSTDRPPTLDKGAGLKYLQIDNNGISKAVSEDFLPEMCELQQVVRIDSVGLPEPCLVDTWRNTSALREDMCAMVLGSKDERMGRYSCSRGGVEGDYLAIDNVTSLSSSTGFGQALTNKFGVRNTCPLLLPCPVDGNSYSATAAPVRYSFSIRATVRICDEVTSCHPLFCPQGCPKCECVVDGCLFGTVRYPQCCSGGICNTRVCIEEVCDDATLDARVELFPFLEYCYSGSPDVKNLLISFSGNVQRLEDFALSAFPAEGNTLSRTVTSVTLNDPPGGSLDDYIKNNVLRTCDSTVNTCADKSSSPANRLFSRVDYSATSSLRDVYSNRKCLPVDDCALFDSLPEAVRTAVRGSGYNGAATVADQRGAAGDYITKFNSMYSECVAGTGTGGPLLLQNDQQPGWMLTPETLECQVGSLAFACAGKDADTKFWKYLWNNSAKQPNEFTMDCSVLGVSGAVLEVTDAAMGVTFNIATVGPAVAGLCSSRAGGDRSFSRCTIQAADLSTLASGIIGQDGTRTRIQQLLDQTSNAVGLRVFYTCKCPAGFLPDLGQDSGGAFACKPCPVGQIRANLSDASCSACPAGTIPNTVKTACVSCPALTYSDSGFESCLACGVGEVDVDRLLCETCGVNQRRPDNETQCIDCEPGYFAYELNSNETHDSPGLVLAAQGVAQCTPCPKGYYRGSGDDRCLPCPAGSYAPFEASTSCTPCPAGTYAAATKTAICSDCPIGFFCGAQSINPSECPDGTATNALGAKTQDECRSTEFIDFDAFVDDAFCSGSPENLEACQNGSATAPAGVASAGRHLLQTPTLARTCEELFQILQGAGIIPERWDYGWYQSQVGNGVCNYGPFNTLVCGWDGGDCCCSTCEKQELNDQLFTQDPDTLRVTLTGYNSSSEVGAERVGCEPPFTQCKDPVALRDTATSAKCLNASACTELSLEEFPPNVNITADQCIPELNGNGICNPSQNGAACGWDGGDCCPKTCQGIGLPSSCSTCQCLDPNRDEDTVPPVLRNFPSNVSVVCVSAGVASLPPVTRVTAYDPNDILFSPATNFTEQQVIVSVDEGGSTYKLLRTWSTAVDAGGSSETRTQTITVNSTTAPYVGVPSDKGPGCNNDCTTSGNTSTCVCRNATGLVGCLVGPRKNFTLTNLVNSTVFGWGNSSTASCLAQFYQARLLISGCQVVPVLPGSADAGTCSIRGGGNDIFVRNPARGDTICLTFSIDIPDSQAADESALRVVQSGILLRVVPSISNPEARVCPAFFRPSP